MADKRYQVFVSSTYEDLRQERQEVMQALLELDCIPAGMELFPATDDDQWTLIRRVIDECDYYIVIVGGRYGSIGPKGIGYTEQEYRYATEAGKPVIAFLHKDPKAIAAGKSEAGSEGQAKLTAFRELCQKKVCKYWESPTDLGSVVSRSIVRLISTHPMPGWIRADKAAASVAAAEMLRLKKTIEELQARLTESQLSAPSGTERLAQGEDTYLLKVEFQTIADDQIYDVERSYDVSWNEMFEELGPLMLDEAADEKLRVGLLQLARRYVDWSLEEESELQGHRLRIGSISVDVRDHQTVVIQLRALGLIEQSKKQRSIKDTRTFWSLTPYGDSVLVKLRAIEKSPPA